MVVFLIFSGALAVMIGVFYTSEPNKYTPAYSTALRCSSGSRLPTPSFGMSGGVFSVCSEQTIHSSLESVYHAILDFHQYDRWNSFIYHVDLPQTFTDTNPISVGNVVTLRSSGLMPGGFNSSSNNRISVLDIPRQGSNIAVSAWTASIGRGWLMYAEHPNLLTDLGDGTVRYVSYETQYGPIAWVILFLLRDRIQSQFEAQGRDLKVFLESPNA